MARSVYIRPNGTVEDQAGVEWIREKTEIKTNISTTSDGWRPKF